MKPDHSKIDALLGSSNPRAGWRRPLPWLLLALLLAGGGLAAWWLSRSAQQAAPRYISEPLKRGTLALQVAANGSLQPTRSVNIGSELSGTVRRVLVDVNDQVAKGQVLLELDTAKLQDQVLRSRAQLAAAQASLAQAQASRKEAEATLSRFETVAQLSGGQVPAATELDVARAAVERARAAEASAEAGIAQARATLSTDATNLAKSSIRSPIDGVVLARSVDPGNAVAASLQAVTLFVIAEDLRSLRLQVAVDEADVGLVKPGQSASFTVSSQPDRPYPARIARVAYGSTKTDGVVTYSTDLEVDNPDLSLRPGMTASATIVATERRNVLLLPNSALRFKPAQAGAAAPPASGSSLLARLMPRPPGGTRSAGTARNGNAAGAAERQVWVLREGQPQALTVRIGLSDGRFSEVLEEGSALREGMAVITDQRSAGAAP